MSCVEGRGNPPPAAARAPAVRRRLKPSGRVVDMPKLCGVRKACACSQKSVTFPHIASLPPPPPQLVLHGHDAPGPVPRGLSRGKYSIISVRAPFCCANSDAGVASSQPSIVTRASTCVANALPHATITCALQLADLNQGVIGLSFRYVDCAAASNPGSSSSGNAHTQPETKPANNQQVSYQQPEVQASSNSNSGSWAERLRSRFFGGRR